MDKENLSGRIERDLLEKVWERFPGANKTESYRSAFLAALDCNTREHVPTVGLSESVTQNEVIELLDVREKALTHEIDKLKEGMKVLNDNIKKVPSSSNVEERLNELQHNIDTLSGMILNV